MKRWTILLMGLLALACLSAAGAQDEMRVLESPGFRPSHVDAQGFIHEPWGVFGVRLVEPKGAETTKCVYSRDPAPTAVTVVEVGPLVMTQTAYRAPIWPGGMDYLTVRLENTGSQDVTACLEVVVPESAGVSENALVSNAGPVVLLPEGMASEGKEREWGCATGNTRLPGWGRPAQPCDGAFKNIRAGMGGVPIKYRFAVGEEDQRTVVLGFCESHWKVAGQRRMDVCIEGAPKMEVEPVGDFGVNVPACLVFAGRDVNKDGKLEAVVAPHSRSRDKNPIVNAIWVFRPEVYVDKEQVLEGNMNEAAEYYVDAGGEHDQALFVGGKVTRQVALAQGVSKTIAFMAASPGCTQLPNPEATAWTPESLRKAAEDVWK